MNDRRIALFDPTRFWTGSAWDDFAKDMVPASTGEMEMYEDDDNVVVKMKAAGFTSDQIDVSIEGKVLTVTGKIEQEKEEEDKKRKYYYKEMRNESFARSISLPSNVKADKVKADLNNGILQIQMPKVEEAKPKKISINVG